MDKRFVLLEKLHEKFGQRNYDSSIKLILEMSVMDINLQAHHTEMEEKLVSIAFPKGFEPIEINRGILFYLGDILRIRGIGVDSLKEDFYKIEKKLSKDKFYSVNKDLAWVAFVQQLQILTAN